MQGNRWSFGTTALSAAVAIVVSTPALAQTSAAADEGAPRAKDDTVRLGTITIVGEGSKLGAGQMLNEDAVKGRSTVTKEAVEKDRATGNPFQALTLLPSVNTFNHDATGLFGGGITVRGFSGDQIGLTINGVPVNDSGAYAVYPQEYADQENLCTQSIAQGNPDVESPHSGATGGSIGVTSCDPENKRRFRVAQTLGGLNLSRTFLRLDTGRFANDKAKVFLSYSHTEADKWKGPGKAKKDHLDAAFNWDITPDNRILGSVLYNRAINNNINNPTLAQLNANGYYWDYSSTFVGHLPAVNGTKQTEANQSPAYYKLSANPFENAIVSLSGSFKLAEDTYLKLQPYLWYGFGTGGIQQTVLSETAFLNISTGKNGAGVDLNGDGDTLDSVIVARSSVTKTSRPGVTAEINKTIGQHFVRAGIWYERAEHRQTQPAVAVDANGDPRTIWLDKDEIRRPDGSLHQGRDWLTISTAHQFYISDQISFMGDRGMLSLGLRTPKVTRDVTNNANEGFTTAYKLNRSYDDLLPQLGMRFALDKSQQVFMNIGKNFRAPPNFAFTGGNVRLLNGVVVPYGEVKAETSIMTDIGYRLQTKAVSVSATLFNVDFKDRQANAYDAVLDRNIYTNAGRVNNRGLELEVGSGAVNGFTAYASVTAQKSEMKDDLRMTGTATLPTKGKQFTQTPEMMIGTSVQYSAGPLYARLKLKHTTRQMATLMNDEVAPAYTVADLDAGYSFGTVGMMSNTQLRMNISNLGNAKYRNPSSAAVTNAVATNGYAAQTVRYYLGSPRFFSVSLSADFN